MKHYTKKNQPSGNRLFWYLSPYPVISCWKRFGGVKMKVRRMTQKNINRTFASTFLTAPTEMCLLKAKTAKVAQKKKLLAANSTPSALGLPRLPCGKPCRHRRWTAEDGEAGKATWEQCRTSLFWTAWMKLGKPELSWIWNWWGTWETTRWASRGTKGSLRNWLLGEAGKFHPCRYPKFSRTGLWVMLLNFFLLRLGHCWYPPEPSRSLF